jgi:CheY-like chemotaxis protein
MGKKILLADDSITIQKVIELTFSDEDFDVVTVGNGRLAVERIQEVQPDIVLCDIIMPEKDGYDVCEFVKRNPATAHVPVLLLTGAFEPFDQERAARVGSDGYLAKPFEPQTLISKVKELLGRPARSIGAPPIVAPAAAAPRPSAGGPPKPPSPPPLPAVPHAAPPPPPVRGAAPPVVAPPPAGLPEPEVTFIPEEPYVAPEGAQAVSAYGGGPDDYSAEAYSADSYAAPIEFQPEGAAESEPRATLDTDFYQPAEAEAGEIPELVADDEGIGTYVADESLFAGDELVAGQQSEAGAPAEAGVPWAQPTAEVSWEERAQAVSEGSAAPVFEDVFDAPAAEAPTPAGPGSESEPTLHEYEPTFEPQLEHEPTPTEMPGGVPEPAVEEYDAVTAEARAAVPGVPTAAELFEEQGMVFEAEEARRSVDAPPSAPIPQRAESFADLSVPAPRASAPATGSVAADVSVPMDMVAQIAQRVVAQMTEKVVREVAWEILPDLAEALIKKEIERLTAELKEP